MPNHNPMPNHLPALRVVSRALHGAAAARVPTELVRLLPADAAPIAWLRDGNGIVAWGEAARITTGGETRFKDADEQWRALTLLATVHDEVGIRGTGLIAFGSFAFAADSPAGGVLIVPRVIIGRRDNTLWRTDIFTPDDPEYDACPHELAPAGVPDLAAPPRSPGAVTFTDDRPSADWQNLVGQTSARIRDHEQEAVHKVVLARSVTASCLGQFDVRSVVRNLSAGYPTTWTFCVDGLVGATPEMLLHLRGNRVHSRVLAGTQPQSGHPQDDERRRNYLKTSTKDLLEHEYAVRSVRTALDGIGECRDTPDSPYILQLPNVAHLATDIDAMLPPGRYSSLELAGLLHPSAAVCGAPTDIAAQLISSTEGLDRDRYAGPVGWIDAQGDGEWAIALRTARFAVDRRSARLFAGGGIMADSVPESEYLETIAKLQPMVRALG